MNVSRHNSFVLSLLALVGLSAPVTSQSLYTFPEDSASIGIFVCDYLSHDFEGGLVRHYPICSIIDTTGIPMIIRSQSPMDLGWIRMEYSCTGDTVFHATIIWGGQGQIMVPPGFVSPDSFPVSGELQAVPTTTTYLHHWGVPIDPADYPDRIAAADSIWAQLSRLAVIHEFAKNEFHILLYMYPPMVGVIDFTLAKWILFIYRNPLVGSTEEYVDTAMPVDIMLINECYPNPSSSSTLIDFTLLKPGAITVTMHDMKGRELRHIPMGRLLPGRYSKRVDLSLFPSGLYVMAVEFNALTMHNKKIAIIR